MYEHKVLDHQRQKALGESMCISEVGRYCGAITMASPIHLWFRWVSQSWGTKAYRPRERERLFAKHNIIQGFVRGRITRQWRERRDTKRRRDMLVYAHGQSSMDTCLCVSMSSHGSSAKISSIVKDLQNIHL